MENEIQVFIGIPSARRVVQGTSNVDVIAPYSSTDVASLATLTFSRDRSGNLIIRYPADPANGNGIYKEIDTVGMNPAVDKIRTAQGDFTIQEIFDHGHDAPFYKQARINATVRR